MAVRVARADAGGRGEPSTDRPMILVPSRVKACSSAFFRVCDEVSDSPKTSSFGQASCRVAVLNFGLGTKSKPMPNGDWQHHRSSLMARSNDHQMIKPFSNP